MAFRTNLKTGISGAAFALAIAGTPALAQQAQPDTQEETDADGQPVDADAVDDENRVIVRGFRASLESAVSEKKNSDQILESVTAEDIGKLPDDSIGESIARLPGVTSQRLNGRANVIAIRGLGPDFSQTLLNGREQTSTGDNRAVEFDQYASEVVNQVVVYKSPSASLVGQGLVGTIDIRTVRPLEVGEQVLAIGARGSYSDLGALNAGSNEYGYRVSGAFVDQFADDTIGVSLAASFIDEPYQLQEFNAWGYTGGPSGGAALIGGSKSFVTSTQLKRLGIAGTVQAELNSNFTLTVDAFYSDFDDDQIKRGVELPLGFCVNPGDPLNRASAFCFGATYDNSGQQVTDNVVTAGRFPTVEGVVRNDIFQRQAELFSGGINLAFDDGDGWTGFFDVGYSRTDRNELSFESYAGTGYNANVGATDDITFTQDETGAFFTSTLDYSDPNQIVLTDPLGWGGSRVQAGYFNDRIVDDSLWQYRFHIERELDLSLIDGVQFGFNYTDRDKSLTPDEFFITLGGATEATIPASFILGSTDLSYLGLGPMLSYDPRDLIDAGVYTLERNTSNDIPAKAFRVTEDLITAYLQLDLEADLGGTLMTGNVGVQAINAEQESTGIAFFNGNQVSVRSGANYWDVLPSINLNFRLPSDFVIRAAASRQIQRPRLDDLRAAIGYGINNNPGESPTGLIPFISGGGGNPALRPFRANAVDLTFEKYFAEDGVLALQLFYKDIVSYITGSRVVFDFAGFPVPAGQTPATTIGNLDSNVNTGGGNFYGAEFAFTLPFDIFTSALEGFGVTGGASYTKTEVEDANGNMAPIPGYSEWVANGTVFFETGGFNARASGRYRSTFLGDFTGFGGQPTRRQAREEFIVDAQIGYDFPDGSTLEGLSLYLQGQNLTDQPFVSIDGNGNVLQVIDYQQYGRRFLAGFTYKF